MKSNTTTTTTTTTVLGIDRYSKAINSGALPLHASQGDNQLSWQHFTEPHMEIRIISTAPSGRSKAKGKATVNSPLAQIQMMVAHRRVLSSNADVTVLENLDLNQAAMMTPLESGGAPIKALTKGLSIGFKYIVESQTGRQYHRFQVRFKRKDDIDKVRTLISSLIPFKDAAASVPSTQANLLPNVSTMIDSQHSMTQQLPQTSSQFYGYSQPFVDMPSASQSQPQRTSTIASLTQWQSLTLPPIRTHQESLQNQPFVLPFPPTPPSSIPSADFSDHQSGQRQSSQVSMYPRPTDSQCAPVSKRSRLSSGAISSDDMDIFEDENTNTQPKRRRFAPATNSQAIQTDPQNVASVSVNPDDEMAAFLSCSDPEAAEHIKKHLEDPELIALVGADLCTIKGLKYVL